MKKFDSLSHSDAFMKVLVEKVRRHAVLSKDPAEPTGRTVQKMIED